MVIQPKTLSINAFCPKQPLDTSILSTNFATILVGGVADEATEVVRLQYVCIFG